MLLIFMCKAEDQDKIMRLLQSAIASTGTAFL